MGIILVEELKKEHTCCHLDGSRKPVMEEKSIYMLLNNLFNLL